MNFSTYYSRVYNLSKLKRAIYLLGAEDTGIPDNILNDCDSIVQLPGNYCLNVAVAGSIVLYDRNSKR